MYRVPLSVLPSINHAIDVNYCMTGTYCLFGNLPKCVRYFLIEVQPCSFLTSDVLLVIIFARQGIIAPLLFVLRTRDRAGTTSGLEAAASKAKFPDHL